MLQIDLSGCKGSATNNQNNKKLLTEGDWSHYNAFIGQAENISFNKNNEYFYGDSSGEPVGDSDLYDTYSYDGNDKITLKCSYEDGVEDIDVKILYIDDMNLLLDLGDDIVEFYNQNNMENCLSAGYEENYDDCALYLEGYDAYSTITAMTDEDIEIAPANYDGDVESFDKYKRTVELSDMIEFYELTINSEFKNEERISHKCSCTELSRTDVETLLDSSDSSALLWYNEEGQITKIIFYGATSVYE